MGEPLQIDVEELDRRRKARDAIVVLDVREPWETDLCAIDGSLLIPMSQVPQRIAEVSTDHPIAVLCHHGGRSAMVTNWLRQHGYDRAINVEGGIDAWARRIDSSMRTY
ncbi:MAG TPA: rhodanese-like domain-containing protein [Azospirillaceae bacterium]|nr:rhodanese-like domain-containing protein [Azospirillaceae bacterium]